MGLILIFCSTVWHLWQSQPSLWIKWRSIGWQSEPMLKPNTYFMKHWLRLRILTLFFFLVKFCYSIISTPDQSVGENVHSQTYHYSTLGFSANLALVEDLIEALLILIGIKIFWFICIPIKPIQILIGRVKPKMPIQVGKG